MPFADFEELREPLALPYRGKTYTIRPVGMIDAPRLVAAFDDPAESSLTAGEFRTMLLGEAWDEMQADNVPPEFALRCEMTALADFRAGREHAQFMWETGGDPESREGMGGEPDPRVTELGYGGGEYHPDTGLYDWYEDVPDVARGGSRALSWAELFEQWTLVEATFAEVYRLDLEDEIHRRTWRWFRVRLSHLLSTETALARHFREKPGPDD